MPNAKTSSLFDYLVYLGLLHFTDNHDGTIKSIISITNLPQKEEPQGSIYLMIL